MVNRRSYDMFGSTKKIASKVDNLATNVDIVLGKTSNLQGTLKGSGVARMDGTFEGNVDVEGDLFVGTNADLVAEIKVQNITVSGKITGNIVAQNKVELLSTAKVTGDIVAKNIVIEEGARFTGRSQSLEDMTGAQQE